MRGPTSSRSASSSSSCDRAPPVPGRLDAVAAVIDPARHGAVGRRRERPYPREVGRLIRRCLEKDPARRLQSSLDLRNELEELRTELTSGTAGPAVIRSGSSTRRTRPYRPRPRRRHLSQSRRQQLSSPRPQIPLRWLGAVAALLLAGGVYWALMVRDPARSSAPPVAESAAAAPATIGTFENRTGDAALNFVGQMLADAIARELPQLVLLQQPTRSAAAPPNTPARPRVTVSGSYYLVGDSYVSRRRWPMPTGTLLHSIEPAMGPRAETAKVVELAQDRVLGAIATFTDPADPAGRCRVRLSTAPFAKCCRDTRYSALTIPAPQALHPSRRARSPGFRSVGNDHLPSRRHGE